LVPPRLAGALSGFQDEGDQASGFKGSAVPSNGPLVKLEVAFELAELERQFPDGKPVPMGQEKFDFGEEPSQYDISFLSAHKLSIRTAKVNAGQRPRKNFDSIRKGPLCPQLTRPCAKDGFLAPAEREHREEKKE
jgi:hypothetical protein